MTETAAASNLASNTTSTDEASSALKRTPLYNLHLARGAKTAPFAGYDMPIQYPDGVLKEHLHTRAAAGLFDVSHMGQAWLRLKDESLTGDAAHKALAAALETLAPAEFQKLKPGGVRYSVFLNEDGGILDDFMTTRPTDNDGSLFLVVNAACKDDDFALLNEKLGDVARLEIAEDRALIALQGPKAAGIVDRLFPGAAAQKFMTMTVGAYEGDDVYVSRCGYTGEDGFELSVPAARAESLANTLLDDSDVALIGLGARDSLRLEAGLCLYGHDLDETTSPIEGNIGFAIGKRRRTEGGFPGADRIQKELAEGPARLRVGVKPEGRAPAREGVKIVDAAGTEIGVITSGGFGPSAEGPVAMGYVDGAKAEDGAEIGLLVRGKTIPARIVPMPFVPHTYYRG